MNEVITKREIVIEIANRTDLRQADIQRVIDEFADIVSGQLAQGNEVALRRFGSFKVKFHKSRVGRNPLQPEKEMVIAPRAVAKFESSKQLRERLVHLQASAL